MDCSLRRELRKENAVVTNVSTAIDVNPIWLSILYKPFLGLHFALWVVPLKIFVIGN
jgi:hypothetical protein